MNYEDFLRQIELRVKCRLGEEVRTRIVPVMKNNSVKLDGLSILKHGDNVSPAIYLNEFYQNYLAGETLDTIVTRVIGRYYQGRKIGNLDTSFFTQPECVRGNVVCRLVNFKKNRSLLEEVPYRAFLDLAIVYYCLMDHEIIGNAAVLVRREHLAMWKMDENTLHEAAVQNTRRLLPWDFLSMTELMETMMHADLSGEEPEIPLYILSNREKNFGAIWMTDIAVLDRIGERLKTNYYILPSSVHECMVLPVGSGMDVEMLGEMVREINETQVEPEEVLGDTVYQYSRERKTLSAVLQR